MRILVTGGAGFIGSHLCESLSKKHEVICMDNMAAGKAGNLRGMDVEFLRQDIRKPFSVDCGLIFNMASPASPADYQLHPMETIEANVFGMRNVLECARKCGARLVHASTSEVYGDPLVHPQKESYWGNVNTLGPRACYDESKRFAETLCYNYHKAYGTRAVLARIFNTYGPRMRADDGRAVPNFIMQALSGKDITIYGSGRQTRSFCYISDLVDGLQRLAFSRINFGAFNLGNPSEITLLELAEKVRKICGSKSGIAKMPLPQDDPRQRRPDISKVAKATGWKPQTPLDEGLKRTVAWFRSEVKR